MQSDEITTGVDKLVSLIDEKRRISITDAAAQLAVPKVVIEEWADFLHQQGVIDMEYKFTTPFLVKRELSQKEIVEKSKEFEGKKEGFSRKVESTIDYITRESAGLKKLKDDFRKLGSDLEGDVRKVRDELLVLQNYEALKKSIDKEIIEQQTSFQKQMELVDQQILASQKSFDDLASHIKEQELKLDQELEKSELIRKNEDVLKARLRKIEQAAQYMERQLRQEDSDVSLVKANIFRIKRLGDMLRKGLETRKNEILPLIEKRKQHEKRISALQDEILMKVVEKQKSIENKVAGSRLSRERFERFFDEKVSIDMMMDRINIELSKLKHELDSILTEARLLELASSKKMSRHMEQLERKFKGAEAQRQKFEGEIFQLGKLIKGRKE